MRLGKREFEAVELTISKRLGETSAGRKKAKTEAQANKDDFCCQRSLYLNSGSVSLQMSD